MFPNPILSIGDVHVYLYGLLIAIGILACFFILFEFSKRAGIPNEYVDFAFYNGIASIVIGFIGSALWQGLFQYIEDVKNGVPNPQFSLKSGITAIGGLATGAITFIVICIIFRKKYPYALTKLVAVAPMCMLVAHGFGRLGCLMAGCCHGEYLGQEYVFGGIKMDGSKGWGYYVPTQLYEALFLLLLCAVLSLLLLRRNFKFALPIYLASYGIWRFLIEFARADDRGAFIGSLSPSQTLSLILVVLSVPAYFILKKFVTESKAYDAKKRAEASISSEG